MYSFVKIWVRLALHFYCSKIVINTKHQYIGDAPLILASTHPNSFFDAMILGATHPRTFYFLARGDAFTKKWAIPFLRSLNMRPIYRLSEGKENLDKNRQTFDQSVEILKEKGALIIFSEGICVNEWKLRPLKKGTARIAWMCWEEENQKDLIVQPVGMNYHSFEGVPKRICIEYGPAISSDDVSRDNPANFYNEFNDLLTERLEPLCFAEDDVRLKKNPGKILLKVLLALPALLGLLVHRVPYVFWRGFIKDKTKRTVFYDSVLFASLLILYPIIVLLVTIITVVITSNVLWGLLFFILPFTAWSYKQYKSL